MNITQARVHLNLGLRLFAQRYGLGEGPYKSAGALAFQAAIKAGKDADIEAVRTALAEYNLYPQHETAIKAELDMAASFLEGDDDEEQSEEEAEDAKAAVAPTTMVAEPPVTVAPPEKDAPEPVVPPGHVSPEPDRSSPDPDPLPGEPNLEHVEHAETPEKPSTGARPPTTHTSPTTAPTPRSTTGGGSRR